MLLAALFFACLSANAFADNLVREYHSERVDPFFNCYLINEEQIPLILSPKNSQVSLDELKGWVEENANELVNLVNQFGAVLLRDFPIHHPDDFAVIIETIFQQPLIDYRGGEELRRKVSDGIYTATEIPSQYQIPLHHELSCTNQPPRHVCFFYDVAAEDGRGQTTLGKTDQISQAIENHSTIWEFFDGQTLKYISRHPPEGNYYSRVNKTHKTWQEVFETTNQEDVEELCREKGFDFTWCGDWLEVYRYVPAIRAPDEFFEFPYWYNQLHLYYLNPRLCGGWWNYQLARLLYSSAHTRPYDVELADGTPIPRDVVYAIYDILEENTIILNWQEKDVLIINNQTTLHGRPTCKNEERILISMFE